MHETDTPPPPRIQNAIPNTMILPSPGGSEHPPIYRAPAAHATCPVAWQRRPAAVPLWSVPVVATSSDNPLAPHPPHTPPTPSSSPAPCQTPPACHVPRLRIHPLRPVFPAGSSTPNSTPVPYAHISHTPSPPPPGTWRSPPPTSRSPRQHARRRSALNHLVGRPHLHKLKPMNKLLQDPQLLPQLYSAAAAMRSPSGPVGMPRRERIIQAAVNAPPAITKSHPSVR